MKKGLLTLALALFMCVGLVGFAALPQMWGIPDVIIGDQEDVGVTDNLFVFTDAFAFADYFIWSTGGKKDLKWHYFAGLPDGQIAVNRTTSDASIDLLATSDSASFRNLWLSPVGGPYTLTPVTDPVGQTTDVCIVTLQTDNYLITEEQDITVYSVDGGNDALTNEYLLADVMTETSVELIADWEPRSADYPASVAIPTGVSGPDTVENTTDGALELVTTGDDNDFGSWGQLMGADAPIPWEANMAFAFVSTLYAIPEVPVGEEAEWYRYTPEIRLRVNSANETISSLVDIQSLPPYLASITSDVANASTETMIFDPRDHSSFVAGGIEDMYFSIDLIDFSKSTPNPPEEFIDDEGTVGLMQLEVSSFPQKMIARESTALETIPDTGFSFDDIYDQFQHVEIGYGGATPQATTDSAGNLLIEGVNSINAFAYHGLTEGNGIDITDASLWYYAVFAMNATNRDAHQIRLRLFDKNFQRSSVLTLSNPDGTTARNVQLPGTVPDEWTVYFVPPAGLVGSELLFAFDFIDFAPWGDSDVSLWSVEFFTASPAALAP